MKKMKKLLSALLAIAMLMSMVLPVSAEGIAVRVSDFELLEAAPAEEIVAPAPEVETEETAPVTVVTEEITVEAEVAAASGLPAITGNSFDVSLPGGSALEYQFTPAEDGRYLFYYPSMNHGIGFEVQDNNTGGYQYATSWQNPDNSLRGNYFNLVGGTEYRVRVNNWWGDEAQSCTVGVTKLAPFDSIWFNGDAICYVGSEVHVTVAGSPEFSAGNISWSISDTSIASENFSDNGGITLNGLSVGTVTVTATTDAGLSATFEVTVKEMESLTVGENFVTLPAERQTEFAFTAPESGNYIFYMPNGIWNIGFDVFDATTGMNADRGEWQHPDGMYHGRIFQMTAGTSYRVRIGNWQSADQSFALTIVKAVPYDEVWIEGDNTCFVDSNAYLSLRGNPVFAAEKANWSVSNPDVVRVEWSGGTNIQLYGIKTGTTVITATTESGKTASIELTVKGMETITGNSFNVSLPANGEEAFLYTPAESGTYIFYFNDRIWNIGFTVYKYDDNEWVDRGDWANSQTGDHGNAFALTGGTTYRIVVDNHDSMDRYETVSIAKAVPYDTLWIEGNSVCYVGDYAYLRLCGTPDFAMEAAQWTVSDPSVVQVRYAGAGAADLLGLSVGTTTVTATTASGKTAVFELTVAEMETITGNSFDVTIPAGSNMKYLFTPAEDGEYIFYLPNGVWSMGFNVRRQDNDNWVDGGDWENANSGYHGSVFALSKDVSYLLTVNNWDNYQMSATVSIAKAVPYDAFWIEGNNTCYVDSDVYLRVYGEPTFAAESVQWTISNPNVVEVDYSGTAAIRLFGRAVGTTTVTATTASGKTATFELKVKEMEALGTEPMAVTVPAGESMQVSFTPAESGNYIVYLLANAECGLEFWNMNAGEWNSDDGLYYGRAAEMTAGETAMIRLNNWRNYEQTVTVAAVKAVPYEHIAFRNAPMGFVGEEAYVQVTGGPGFAYSPIQWSSSNPAVASITYENGTGANFMCHTAGTTIITATTSNGLSISYEMTVSEMPVLKVGETTLLTIPYEAYTKVLFTPAETGTYIFEHAGDQYFGIDCRDSNWNWFDRADWTSSDGTRRGYSYTLQGGMTYTLQVYNWNVQGIAELELTATKAVPYTKLAFVHDSYTGYLSNYESVPIKLEYAPEYGGEELIVKSSNENVVVPGWVSGDRIYLNPVATGTATVTISTVDGRLKDTCTVTIKEPIAITSGKEQSMTIESAGYALFKFTPATSATYAFYCVDNENFGFSVHNENGNWVETSDRWANNALIAEWDAVAGTTYYIPFHNHGDAKNTFKVGVGQPTKATSMTIPAQDFDLYPYIYFYMQPVFAPVLSETQAVTWTSSNEKVAKFSKAYEDDSVDVSYEFYAAGAGTATITATSENGLKATVKITVKTPSKINVGNHSVQLPEWDLIEYQFTAPEAGNYVISDESAESTVGWIMANEAEEIFAEGNNQTPVKVYLEKGQTVYPVVVNNTDETKTIAFTIEQGAHEHELKLVEAKDATYAEPGNIAHYACICGKLYADADGKTELTEADVTVPVLEGATTLINEETKTVTIAAGEEVVYLFTAEKTGTYSFVTDRRIGWNLDVETADGQPVATTERPAAADLSGAYQLFGFDIPMTAGDTYILKVSHDMEWEESFEFAIGQFAAATSMKLDKSTVSVYPYEQFALNPDFGSIFAIAEEVTFTSSNPAVVEFNPNYGEETGLAGYGFKPLKPGTATITATSENGLKATCTVTVKTPESIGLGEHTTPVLNDGDSITYYFTPEVSGKYDLYLTSEMDFVLQWSSLKENERELWKGPEYVGFRAYLEAGETYTIYVNNFYMQGSKTFTFWLSEAHEHAIKPVEAKAPTYTEDGYEAHYACDCGVLFADAEGTIETDMDSIRIPMLIQISEGKAEVPKEVIDDFVAEVEQGGEVSIPVAEAGTNSKEEVKSAALPVESLTQIAEKEATLTVEMPTATVTMDTAVLAAVVEKAGENATVTLEVAEVAEEDLTESQVAVIEQLEKKPAMTISAELLVNDQPIASKENGGFGENAKVTVKIPVGPGKADYTVLYIADDGTVENIPAVFENGFLILELEHFSDYAIIKNTVPGDVNDDGEINVLDLMYLANFFAKGETINKANADVNNDGTVDVRDLMFLANVFAGKETLG